MMPGSDLTPSSRVASLFLCIRMTFQRFNNRTDRHATSFLGQRNLQRILPSPTTQRSESPIECQENVTRGVWFYKRFYHNSLQ
jgi:hypothetical protein